MSALHRDLAGLSERHRSAIEDAVALVEERFDPWAIIASGTVVRGEADASSDIDLYVLHDAPFRQRLQRRFGDVPAEIFVNPEAAVQGYMEDEARDRRPLTAHMLATGVVLRCRDDERLEALLRTARAALDAPPEPTKVQLVRARYGAALIVEDALDKRVSDPESAMRLLGRAVDATLECWFLRSGGYYPRHKEVLPALEAGDAELGRLARAFWSDRPAEERWDAALSIADRVLGIRGFFEWESEQDPVPGGDVEEGG